MAETDESSQHDAPSIEVPSADSNTLRPGGDAAGSLAETGSSTDAGAVERPGGDASEVPVTVPSLDVPAERPGGDATPSEDGDRPDPGLPSADGDEPNAGGDAGPRSADMDGENPDTLEPEAAGLGSGESEPTGPTGDDDVNADGPRPDESESDAADDLATQVEPSDEDEADLPNTDDAADEATDPHTIETAGRDQPAQVAGESEAREDSDRADQSPQTNSETLDRDDRPSNADAIVGGSGGNDDADTHGEVANDRTGLDDTTEARAEDDQSDTDDDAGDADRTPEEDESPSGNRPSDQGFDRTESNGNRPSESDKQDDRPTDQPGDEAATDPTHSSGDADARNHAPHDRAESQASAPSETSAADAESDTPNDLTGPKTEDQTPDSPGPPEQSGPSEVSPYSRARDRVPLLFGDTADATMPSRDAYSNVGDTGEAIDFVNRNYPVYRGGGAKPDGSLDSEGFREPGEDDWVPTSREAIQNALDNKVVWHDPSAPDELVKQIEEGRGMGFGQADHGGPDVRFRPLDDVLADASSQDSPPPRLMRMVGDESAPTASHYFVGRIGADGQLDVLQANGDWKHSDSVEDLRDQIGVPPAWNGDQRLVEIDSAQLGPNEPDSSPIVATGPVDPVGDKSGTRGTLGGGALQVVVQRRSLTPVQYVSIHFPAEVEQ